MLGILQATAVNGVLAIACTFVIITGGIDLSVGTLMTFCAVMCGVLLTYWASADVDRRRSRRSAPARSAAAFRARSSAKMKIPPFIATLGMMMLLKGLSLVVSGDKPIYFNDTRELLRDLAGFADRRSAARRCRFPTRC